MTSSNTSPGGDCPVHVPWLSSFGIAVALLLACSVLPSRADVLAVKVGPERATPEADNVRLPKARFAPGVPKSAKREYKPKYTTIAHTILEREAALGGVTEAMYHLLDSLIDEAKETVPAADGGADQTKVAEGTLGAIDDLLIRRSFVYPAVGLTQLLSDGMNR